MRGIFWIAFMLTVIGGINWALVGLFNLDLVALLFGEMTGLTRAIYTIVGVSAAYIAVVAPSLRYERPLFSNSAI